MNFENSLSEFYFNLETMNLLRNDSSVDANDISFNDLFPSDLCNMITNFTPSYLNSIIVRMRLYNKQNKSVDDIKLSLKNHESLFPLVEYLFSRNDNHVSEDSVQQDNMVMESNLDNNDVEEKEVDNSVEVEADNEVKSDSDSSEEENPFKSFFDNRITKTNKKNDMISTKEFYSEFKKWFKSEYDDVSVPKKKELNSYLSDILEKKNNNWLGIKL